MGNLPAKAPLLFGLKLPNDYGQITLPSGQRKSVVFLGRGKFSNVYYAGPRSVYIFTQHGDLSKDILCHVHTDMPHVPYMSYLGIYPHTNFSVQIDVYQTHWYNPFVLRDVPYTARNAMTELRLAHAKACSKFKGNIIAKNQCIDFNYYIAEHARVSDKIRMALIAITESAQDWGKTYLFDDFRPKNLGLDSKGRIMFIDAMFDAGLLQKERG